MGKGARKLKAAYRQVRSVELVEDSLLDEMSFEWRVSTGGYRWKEAEAEDPQLTSLSAEPRVYNPLQVGGLFLRFARLAPTTDDYREFANKYGLLNTGMVKRGTQPTTDGDRETWNVWRSAHDAMRRAVGLRKWVLDGVVAQHLSTGGGPWGEVRTSPGAIPWHLADPLEPSRWHMTFTSKETSPEKAAMQVVQKWINTGFEEGARLRLLWHPGRDKYVLRVQPLTLSGCMWWQLARALTGEANYVECRTCGTPLEKGKDAFRVTREFCSPACKQKDHRKRVARAKELNGEGMSLAKIAKQLETKPDVITKWLTKTK